MRFYIKGLEQEFVDDFEVVVRVAQVPDVDDRSG